MTAGTIDILETGEASQLYIFQKKIILFNNQNYSFQTSQFYFFQQFLLNCKGLAYLVPAGVRDLCLAS